MYICHIFLQKCRWKNFVWVKDAFRCSERCILPYFCGDIFIVIRPRSSDFPQAWLHVAAGRPFWLCREGAQRLLSSQCRSCGAVSSYIWLLGLRWQPFLNRKHCDYKRIIIWFELCFCCFPCFVLTETFIYVCVYLHFPCSYISLQALRKSQISASAKRKDDCGLHG